MVTMLLDAFAAAAPTRLLVLTTLLLCTTVLAESDRTGRPAEGWSSVFTEPPAYLHPPAAIGFDVSGLSSAAPAGVEAALLASVHPADLPMRAHAHMSLAVYYKLRGMTDLAAQEKRKGDYWRRIAKLTSD